MACNMSEYYIVHLDTVGSTNSYARAEAARLWGLAGGAPAVVVYADNQTQGRGQRGNVWQSLPAQNLLVSIMVRPTALPVVSQFALSQAVALAVYSAVGYLGVDSVLKWPNDVYVGEHKLSGILVELDCCGSTVEQAVIGVGLNVNQVQFAPMDKTATSLNMLTGETYEIDEVLAVFLDSFSYYYSLLERGDYSLLAAEYKNHLLGFGQRLHYCDADSSFDAAIVDVESDGRIRLQRADGSVALYAFKEVELVI